MAADGATAFWSHQNYSKYACEQYNLDYMTDLAQIVEIDLVHQMRAMGFRSGSYESFPFNAIGNWYPPLWGLCQ
jgi:hypothetical protein